MTAYHNWPQACQLGWGLTNQRLCILVITLQDYAHSHYYVWFGHSDATMWLSTYIHTYHGLVYSLWCLSWIFYTVTPDWQDTCNKWHCLLVENVDYKQLGGGRGGWITVLGHFHKNDLMPVIICKHDKHLITLYNAIFSNMTGIMSHLSYIFNEHKRTVMCYRNEMYWETYLSDQT